MFTRGCASFHLSAVRTFNRRVAWTTKSTFEMVGFIAYFLLIPSPTLTRHNHERHAL